MEIENNILKHQLKNVYFVTGLACGGKTTLCQALAKKYDLTFIGETDNYANYQKIIEPKYQPHSTYQRTDWHTFFNRPPKEYEQWLYGTMEETAKLLLFDLIQASQTKPVITDAYFP